MWTDSSKIREVEYDICSESDRMSRNIVHEAERSGMISKNPTVVIGKAVFPRYGKKIKEMMV